MFENPAIDDMLERLGAIPGQPTLTDLVSYEEDFATPPEAHLTGCLTVQTDWIFQSQNWKRRDADARWEEQKTRIWFAPTRKGWANAWRLARAFVSFGRVDLAELGVSGLVIEMGTRHGLAQRSAAHA